MVQPSQIGDGRHGPPGNDAGPRSADASRVVRLVLLIVLPVVAVLSVVWFLPDADSPPLSPRLEDADLAQANPFTELQLPGVGQQHASGSPIPGDRDAPYPGDAAELNADIRRVVDCLVARFPDSPDCLELKARTVEWMGNSNEARQLWKKCLERDPRFSHALYGLARLSAENADLEEAIQLGRRALEADPGYFVARILVADSLLQLGRPEDAVELMRDYLAVDPRSQGAFLLGQAYLQLDRHQEAVAAFRMTLRLYPAHAEAWSALARALVRMGRKDEAKEALTTARRVQTEQADGRPPRKSRRLDLRMMFDDAALLYGDAGRIYAAHGLVAEAEALLRRATVVSPGDSASRLGLAALYSSQNRLSDAIGILEQVAVVQNDNFEVHLQLARAYASISAWQRADQSIQRACELTPDRADVWATRADLYLRANRKLNEAVRFARKAVDLAPAAANYALLAAACDRADDLAAAVEAINAAVERAPQSAVYRQVQQELQRDRDRQLQAQGTIPDEPQNATKGR
ncbi:MAG: tetratricopeptide repeat protein [Thermoguttaceae bacterium]